MANYCLFLHSIVGAANDLYSSINKAGGLKISMIPFNFKMLWLSLLYSLRVARYCSTSQIISVIALLWKYLEDKRLV